MSVLAREYTVVLTPEQNGGFSVAVPALPEVATQGETLEEALEMAREAIALSLLVRHDDGNAFPADVTPTVRRVRINAADS